MVKQTVESSNASIPLASDRAVAQSKRRLLRLAGHQLGHAEPMPFELHLLNGINPPVPEVTALIHRTTKDRRAGEYRLHIEKVPGFSHWDKRRRKPAKLRPILGEFLSATLTFSVSSYL